MADTAYAGLDTAADVEMVERNGTRLCRVAPHGTDPRAWITENVEGLRAAMLDCGAVMV
jgi:hypothetical protein